VVQLSILFNLSRNLEGAAASSSWPSYNDDDADLKQSNFYHLDAITYEPEMKVGVSRNEVRIYK
jgi:hypothetical protein